MEVTIYKLGNKPEDMFIDIFYYPSIPDIWINYIMLVRGNYPKIALNILKSQIPVPSNIICQGF